MPDNIEDGKDMGQSAFLHVITESMYWKTLENI